MNNMAINTMTSFNDGIIEFRDYLAIFLLGGDVEGTTIQEIFLYVINHYSEGEIMYSFYHSYGNYNDVAHSRCVALFFGQYRYLISSHYHIRISENLAYGNTDLFNHNEYVHNHNLLIPIDNTHIINNSNVTARFIEYTHTDDISIDEFDDGNTHIINNSNVTARFIEYAHTDDISIDAFDDGDDNNSISSAQTVLDSILKENNVDSDTDDGESEIDNSYW